MPFAEDNLRVQTGAGVFSFIPIFPPAPTDFYQLRYALNEPIAVPERANSVCSIVNFDDAAASERD